MRTVDEVRRKASVCGYVTDACSGIGIPNALVELVGQRQQVRTRENGFYFFLDLSSDSYTLRASAIEFGSRYGAKTVDGVIVGTDAEKRPMFDPRGNLRLEPTRLVGRVYSNPESAPVAGAEVWLRASNVKIHSNQAGEYILSCVQAGTQTVQVSVAGFSTNTQYIALNTGKDTRVDFALTPT